MSPSFTASLTMRPLTSEEMSALVFGSTWPLAVTDATRSRRSTFSSRTSVGLLPRVAAASTSTPATSATSTPATPNFAPLVMGIPLSQWVAHRTFERGERFVKLIDRVDAIVLGRRVRGLRIRDVEVRRRTSLVLHLGQIELLASLGRVLFLQRYGLHLRLQREVGGRDVSGELQLLRFRLVVGIVPRRFRLLDLALACEVVEDRERQRRCNRQRHLGKVERELAVFRPDLRGGLRRYYLALTDGGDAGQPSALSNRVFREAARGRLHRLSDEHVRIRQLRGKP